MEDISAARITQNSSKHIFIFEIESRGKKKKKT